MLTQDVYNGLPFAAARDTFMDIMSLGYSVSMSTTWGDDVVDQVWVKSMVVASDRKEEEASCSP